MQWMSNSPPASVPAVLLVLSWTTHCSWVGLHWALHPQLLAGRCLALSWKVCKSSCSAWCRLLCRAPIWRAAAASPSVLWVSAIVATALALPRLPLLATGLEPVNCPRHGVCYSEGLCGVEVPAVPRGLARDPAQRSWADWILSLRAQQIRDGSNIPSEIFCLHKR